MSKILAEIVKESEMYNDQIRERIDKLEENSFYIEDVLLFSVSLEESLIEIIEYFEEVYNLIDFTKIRRKKDLDDMTLGALINYLSAFASKSYY